MEIVDAELIGDQEYGLMDKNAVDRVKTLLGKLDSMRRSKARGSSITDEIKCLSRKFAGQAEKIFNNLSKPLEWRSFYTNGLPLLLDISKEVQDVSVQHSLNKSLIKALSKLKKVSESEFKRLASVNIRDVLKLIYQSAKISFLNCISFSII